MKKIEAMIRHEKLEAVWLALEKAGYPGITVTEITGHGLQKGTLREWHGNRMKLDFLPKLKIEVICPDADAAKISRSIEKAAFTGSVGDGKIFVYDVRDAVRIRTGERGRKALV